MQTLQWRHNGRDSVSNHKPFDCLLNSSFRRRSKETSKLRVTGLCAGKSPVTGAFPAQRASNAENVSIWWRHHEIQWVHTESSTRSGCDILEDKTVNQIEWASMGYSFEIILYHEHDCILIQSSLLKPSWLFDRSHGLSWREIHTIHWPHYLLISRETVTDVNLITNKKCFWYLSYPGKLCNSRLNEIFMTTKIPAIFWWKLQNGN